jgi:hypothetical protein
MEAVRCDRAHTGDGQARLALTSSTPCPDLDLMLANRQIEESGVMSPPGTWGWSLLRGVMSGIESKPEVTGIKRKRRD